MSTTTTHLRTCDKCKATEEVREDFIIQPGWTSIQIKVAAKQGGTSKERDIDLCPKCGHVVAALDRALRPPLVVMAD